jgi:CBS domain-containing protein
MKRSIPTTHLERVTVGDIMTRDVIAVHPDTSVETLMAVFLDRHISGAPVVDAFGRAIGMVSKTDIVRDHYERGDTYEIESGRDPHGGELDLGPGFHTIDVASATVAEVMVPVAFTLTAGEPLARAAALMAYEGVHRIPVVALDGAVIGILSSIDVLRWLAEDRGYALPAKWSSARAGRDLGRDDIIGIDVEAG